MDLSLWERPGIQSQVAPKFRQAAITATLKDLPNDFVAFLVILTNKGLTSSCGRVGSTTL